MSQKVDNFNLCSFNICVKVYLKLLHKVNGYYHKLFNYFCENQEAIFCKNKNYVVHCNISTFYC